MASKQAYKTEVWIDWCPGCGDYGIVAAMQKAFSELSLDPSNTVVVSGIGCSSKTPHYIYSNGVHTLHGRGITYATGIKLANPELTVVVNAGDGDLLGIGVAHFVALGRRNLDVTILLHDNQVYGLTKGQASPTLGRGEKTKSLPAPNIQDPVNPIALALASGYTFIARGYALWIDHLKDLIKAAIKHKGAALIDILQPCVTYNDIYTADYYKGKLYKLEEDPKWDPIVSSNTIDEIEDKMSKAMSKALEWDPKIPVGIFYANPHIDTLEDRIAKRNQLFTVKPPARQPIARNNGEPLIGPEEFKKIFSDYIIKVVG